MALAKRIKTIDDKIKEEKILIGRLLESVLPSGEIDIYEYLN